MAKTKRKPRSAKDHRRTPGNWEPYARVLIVCEGEKTEPNYLKGLVNNFKLSTANVVVLDNQYGSSPDMVVRCALGHLKADPNFNKVYCVFDKDRHDTYQAACTRIKDTKLTRNRTIHAITSVPCFELWLLLHFEYTTRNYYNVHGSVCDQLISDLKAHIQNYEKGNTNIFETLKQEFQA
ncbi:MAG: RloB domain-containing protein [Desulfatibacillum sp.]|nr:RloB domain-containing protein [Desulfatibacillum sp.]